jgi:hypothetical protein
MVYFKIRLTVKFIIRFKITTEIKVNQWIEVGEYFILHNIKDLEFKIEFIEDWNFLESCKLLSEKDFTN